MGCMTLVQSHQPRLILIKFLAIRLPVLSRCAGALNNRFKSFNCPLTTLKIPPPSHPHLRKVSKVLLTDHPGQREKHGGLSRSG